jgi:hypothetical protein|tara:strand:- start:1858 stop:2163 length:306 start_codon:yes stop_codon:yes gene_type:complete
MGKATYEFHYVSPKQKVQLILCKAFLVALILAFSCALVFLRRVDDGQDLVYVSGILQAVFCYINLMTVRAEVQELFEPPVHFKGREFFWLAIVTFVASFFV